MACKTIILFTLLVGILAVPAPEKDMSIFFEHVSPDSRIVGGTVAAEGSAPHMCVMSTGAIIRSLVCGGSVISQRTVLTAAHCIAAVFSSWSGLSASLLLTCGTNRWNSGGRSFSVERNVTHENYVSGTIKNDIGVLILNSPGIEYSALIQPSALTFDNIPGGVLARATGWGRIVAGGAISATLLELFVSTLGGQECVDRVAQAEIELNMRAPPVEPHIEICTFHSRGHGMCNGDSGSALVRVSDNQQIGIVSWGFPCALGAPDMFVRVSAYEDWLARHVV